jgi:hypothetical protein
VDQPPADRDDLCHADHAHRARHPVSAGRNRLLGRAGARAWAAAEVRAPHATLSSQG